jgi:flagellar biogenesis protein FliO
LLLSSAPPAKRQGGGGRPHQTVLVTETDPLPEKAVARARTSIGTMLKKLIILLALVGLGVVAARRLRTD